MGVIKPASTVTATEISIVLKRMIDWVTELNPLLRWDDRATLSHGPDDKVVVGHLQVAVF